MPRAVRHATAVGRSLAAGGSPAVLVIDIGCDLGQASFANVVGQTLGVSERPPLWEPRHGRHPVTSSRREAWLPAWLAVLCRAGTCMGMGCRPEGCDRVETSAGAAFCTRAVGVLPAALEEPRRLHATEGLVQGAVGGEAPGSFLVADAASDLEPVELDVAAA